MTQSVARIKAELQEKGIRIPPELVPELESKYNAPAVSTGRIVVCLESPLGDELIPVFIVNGKRSKYSPYHLAKIGDGVFEIHKDGAKYTDVCLIERPKFYDQLTSTKVPMSKVAVIVGPGHLRSVVNQKCVYQQTGQACKFCAVQHWWNSTSVKRSDDIAETVEAGFDDGSVKHISLTTATLNSDDRGLANLIQTTRKIHYRADIPVMIESEPLSNSTLLCTLLVEAKNAGVASISINIECFDENLREQIMPAKGKIPVKQYLENWKTCVDIFGENQVSTVAVIGIGEDDRSILNGVDMAASLGVITFLVPHSPAIGASYEDMEPPTADRMLRLYHEAANIYEKRGLDLCKCTAGCVRGGGFSAIKDVAMFGV